MYVVSFNPDAPEQPANGEVKGAVLEPLRQSIHALVQSTATNAEACKTLSAHLERANPFHDALLQVQIECYVRDMLRHDPRYADPRRLNHFEHKVFSQFGEDGIIQEVFRRIGCTNRFFLEIGAQVGIENNSANLLLQKWSGCWMEANPECVATLRQGFAPLIDKGRLRVVESLVTAGNIEALLAEASVPSEFDLLSIDIDGNDYWVWNAIQRYRPRVVVIEYNSNYPPPTEWIMPYNPTHVWNHTAFFGASLSSLVQLGTEKGYTLVGCNLGGANAFFVRDELMGDHFIGPFTAEQFFEPLRYFLIHHRLSYARSFETFQAL